MIQQFPLLSRIYVCCTAFFGSSTMLVIFHYHPVKSEDVRSKTLLTCALNSFFSIFLIIFEMKNFRLTHFLGATGFFLTLVVRFYYQSLLYQSKTCSYMLYFCIIYIILFCVMLPSMKDLRILCL